MNQFFRLLSMALLTSSCAYNFSGIKRQVPGGHDRVFIPVFKNASIEPGVEVYFTNAFIREFSRSKAARVTDKNSAQVKIEGVIDVLSYEAIAPVATGRKLVNGSVEVPDLPPETLIRNLPFGTVLATEYRIRVETALTIRRLADNKVIWQGRFKGEKSYAPPQVGSAVVNSVNPLYNHSARHQNIALIAEDMMSEAHDRITENF